MCHWKVNEKKQSLHNYIQSHFICLNVYKNLWKLKVLSGLLTNMHTKNKTLILDQFLNDNDSFNDKS